MTSYPESDLNGQAVYLNDEPDEEQMDIRALKIVEDKLTKLIKVIAQIEVLVNDEWNIDDEVCHRNMNQIKKLMNQDL